MPYASTSLRSVTVGVLTAALCVAGAPFASADLPTLHLLNLNACSNNPACGNVGNEMRVTEAITSSIRSSNPALTYVTLQEMCEAQIEHPEAGLKARTRELGFDWRFLPTGPKCRVQEMGRYGLAVGFRGALSSYQTYDLPNPGGHEPRKMLCVGVEDTSSIACSVHLHTGPGETRKQQVEYVRHAVREETAGKAPLFTWGRAIVAGDFNATPGDEAMDPMYGPNGMHREAFGINNRRNSPFTHTSNRRIDYVWMTDMRGPDRVSGRVADSLYSDHKILRVVIGNH
jgi:endonuclease/exonuclease/phosphatase family metal-dependent hydrolase